MYIELPISWSLISSLAFVCVCVEDVLLMMSKTILRYKKRREEKLAQVMYIELQFRGP